MGEQRRCKPNWVPTTPVSGAFMEAFAHQELMDSPREAQLKLHIGLFFAESELVCLKRQKSRQKSNFIQVSCCCLMLLRAVSAQDVLQHPSSSIIPILWSGRASLCPASCNCPQSPGSAHVLWCCFTTSSQHPRATPAPS